MGIPSFIYASASPARRRLQNPGVKPVVCVSDFDESQTRLNDPEALVQILAQGKAETVAAQFNSGLVLGCDSVLLVNDEIHGKPANAAEAIARWHQMSGQVGDLYTGNALIRPLAKVMLGD